jgi:methyl-accepting chemotaxis protein
MVEESTAATHTLSQETAQLAGLIGQFRIGGVNAGEARPSAAQAPARGPKRVA